MTTTLLAVEKNSSDLYWERVLAPSPEPNCGYLGHWFVTQDEFQGLCVQDRGTGSSRLVELRSHLGLIRITSIDGLIPIDEAPKPEKAELPQWLGEPEVGDRVTWAGAPDWWNPRGERLSEIREGYALVEYWRSPVEFARLRVIVKLSFRVPL